jgi:hypothetical protein
VSEDRIQAHWPEGQAGVRRKREAVKRSVVSDHFAAQVSDTPL